MRAEDRENYRYAHGAQNPIAKEEELMFSLLPNGNQKKLLDVGCGIGTITLELQKKGFQVTGIDFSEVAIDKCLQSGLDVILSDVDKDGLKFPDRSFDIVWAADIIEHVFDPMFLLDEINRVLKDDGLVIMSIPNNFPLIRRIKLCLSGKSVQSNIYRRMRQCKHHTFVSWELLKFMLDESKLAVDWYYSICKIPKIKKQTTTANKTIGRLFGKAFILSARKSSSSAE